MLILYNVALFMASIAGLPYYFLKILFTGKYRNSFIQKLGGRQKKILDQLKNNQWVQDWEKVSKI